MNLSVILAMLYLSGVLSKESIIKGRNKMKSKLMKPKDMCSFEPGDNISVKCFCTKEKYQKVFSAECWIFGSINKEHFIWDLIIKSQPYISEFNIIASNHGYLRNIPSNFLQSMPFLKNLSVSFATLQEIERYSFSNSSSIEELKLVKNQIEAMNFNSISNLPNLKMLNLEDNRIQRIKFGCLYNLPSLKYVKLNNNNITKVDDKAFISLGNVLEMDLSENYICDITNLTFFGLSKLKRLDMSFNRILSLASSVFSELWDIEELYLDYNLIGFISNRAFDGLRFLKTISLSNNKLSRFPAGLLTSVFTLDNLDLSNNKLETLVFDSIENLYNNLLQNGSIRLNGNRFSCDCRLDWVYVLHKKTAQPLIRNSLEELQCTTYTDKLPQTTDITNSLICPSSDRSNFIDQGVVDKFKEAEEEEINDEEDENGDNKTYLMSIPIKELSCPAEYRPTPITVKQGTTSGPLASGQRKLSLGIDIIVFVLMYFI